MNGAYQARQKHALKKINAGFFNPSQRRQLRKVDGVFLSIFQGGGRI
jgi:hypothetical protein